MLRPRNKRCAIYTRKSSEEGLDQEFNSLAAQRDACEAYIRSQQHEGWVSARTRYDDGGFSGGKLERPGLERLLADIRAGRIEIVVVYKVDRLTRSLADFARLVETLRQLRELWCRLYKTAAAPRLSRELLTRAVAYRIQELASGGLRPELQRRLNQIALGLQQTGRVTMRPRPRLKPGTRLLREWQGRSHEVLVLTNGFSWQAMLVSDRDNVTRHDVLCRAAMRLVVVAGQLLIQSDRVQPAIIPAGFATFLR